MKKRLHIIHRSSWAYFILILLWQVSGEHEKALKICSVSGGLDIARLFSNNLKNIFRGALEDVEFIREYVAEAALNQGIVGGLHNLDEMITTLDWEGRNMTEGQTTIDAGLGWVDDRKDRRVDRWISSANQPFVGTKQNDMALIDTVSNILPWIVDRKRNQTHWLMNHQNGINFRDLGNLYTAAFIGTYGDAWVYYPPLNAGDQPRKPITISDIVGPDYSTRDAEFVSPNLPSSNPEKKTFFSTPYPDTLMSGRSLVTALSPVYYSGEFQGQTYENTYIASTGIDISISSISVLLDEVEGTLTKGSFPFVVNTNTFDMVIISQDTVKKIYPTRTGFEEERVTYDSVTNEIILDRRNQTYLVSDTIFQSPLDLPSADWNALFSIVKSTSAGERGHTVLDITLTGETASVPYYAMYKNWGEVADWTLVIVAPQVEVDNAVSLYVEEAELEMEVMSGSIIDFDSTFINNGTIDVKMTSNTLPRWMKLISKTEDGIFRLPANQNLTLTFQIDSNLMSGSSSDLIALKVSADGYSDCFYENVIATNIDIKLHREEDMNHLTEIRPYGYSLAGIIALSSIGWSYWVYQKDHHRIVKAAQPVFLHLMCLGIFTMGMAIIPMGIDDSIASDRGCSIACMSKPWLLGMGFCITFSALFSKVWRINQIVEACKSYQRVNISIRHVIVPFAVIFILNTTTLVLWTKLDPLVWERTNEVGNHGVEGFNSVGMCRGSGAVSVACFLALLVLNFSALILALVQLYRARSVSTEYSEGKYIAIAIGSMAQGHLTGLPLLAIVQNNPQATYFVQSTLVFIVCMSLLLVTFLPKFFIASKDSTTASVSEQSPQHPVSESKNEKSTEYSWPMNSKITKRVPSRMLDVSTIGEEGAEDKSYGGRSGVLRDVEGVSRSSFVQRAEEAFFRSRSRGDVVSDISESMFSTDESEMRNATNAFELQSKVPVDADAPKLPTRGPAFSSIAEEIGMSGPQSAFAVNEKMPSSENANIPKRFVSEVVAETERETTASLSSDVIDDDKSGIL